MLNLQPDLQLSTSFSVRKLVDKRHTVSYTPFCLRSGLDLFLFVCLFVFPKVFFFSQLMLLEYFPPGGQL